MSFAVDFLSLATGSILLLAGHRAEFAVVLGIAAVLSALCWFGAMNYSKLWNLRFATTGFHTTLCVMAAVMTFAFVILFAGFRYTKVAADHSIDAWKVSALAEQAWQENAFRSAYDAVRKLGLEDFSKAPPPGNPSSIIPLNDPRSIATNAQVYAAAAVENFKAERPFLSKIVWWRLSVPQQALDQISARIAHFFAFEGKTIPTREIVQYTADALKGPLQEGTDRVVPIGRAIVMVLFILMQLIPFGVIGWAAWRDLKVTV